jgi:hypothetical protein
VREALIALEVLGLVDVRVGAGVAVLRVPDDAADAGVMDRVMRMSQTEPDPELPVTLDLSVEIPPFALLQARRLVEPETAALAAENASPAQLDGGVRAEFAGQSRGVADEPGRPAVSHRDRAGEREPGVRDAHHAAAGAPVWGDVSAVAASLHAGGHAVPIGGGALGDSEGDRGA